MVPITWFITGNDTGLEGSLMVRGDQEGGVSVRGAWSSKEFILGGWVLNARG